MTAAATRARPAPQYRSHGNGVANTRHALATVHCSSAQRAFHNTAGFRDGGRSSEGVIRAATRHPETVNVLDLSGKRIVTASAGGGQGCVMVVVCGARTFLALSSLPLTSLPRARTRPVHAPFHGDVALWPCGTKH